jgi:hypothetical protein
MALVQTARHRALVSARSVRRTRRSSVATTPARAVAAVQVFVSKLDQFLGVELFAGDQPVVVGRHRSAQLRLSAENISREHLRITLEGGALFVEDLGSANGTLINRKKLAGKVEVRPSDTLQVGPYALRLRALMPVADRADSSISDADTKVDAVLAASGSRGTEESSVELAGNIDWRIYDEAIRRATGAEPARNVIHLTAKAPLAPQLASEASQLTAKSAPQLAGEASQLTAKSAPPRHDTETRVKEPMDEEDVAERRATAKQAPAFLALLRSVNLPAAESEPETAPELDLDAPLGRSTATRLAELERLMARLEQSQSYEAPREPTRPERQALRDDDELDAIDATPVQAIPGMPFDVVPAQSMLSPERDALDGTAVHDDEGTCTEVEAPGAPIVGRRYDSLPLSPEVIARSLMAPAGSTEREVPRMPARLVTPSAQVPVGSVPVIQGLPSSEVSPAPRVPTRLPPVPSRRVSSVSMRGVAPRGAQEVREVATDRHPTLSRGVPLPRGVSRAPEQLPVLDLSRAVASRAAPSQPAPAASRAVAQASTPSPSQAVPAVSRAVPPPMPTAGRPSPSPSQGVAAPSRAAIEGARGLVAVRSSQSEAGRAAPAPRAPSLAPAEARPASVAAPSRAMSATETRRGSLVPVAVSVPPPLPSARPSIPVQIPTGPRVTFTPPEALGGSGRVKVSGVTVPPPLPRAPQAPVRAESVTAPAAAPATFDGVEITARAGERTLDITTLRREGDQYVLGHPTPIGVVAPPSSHPGLRLLRIDQDRNVDLVFPREVAGQLLRDGETITLHELTEGRKYSCLRLRAGDVVTVMLGIGPKQVSYHIRFVRAPRSISVARARAASQVTPR